MLRRGEPKQAEPGTPIPTMAEIAAMRKRSTSPAPPSDDRQAGTEFLLRAIDASESTPDSKVVTCDLGMIQTAEIEFLDIVITNNQLNYLKVRCGNDEDAKAIIKAVKKVLQNNTRLYALYLTIISNLDDAAASMQEGRPVPTPADVQEALDRNKLLLRAKEASLLYMSGTPANYIALKDSSEQADEIKAQLEMASDLTKFELKHLASFFFQDIVADTSVAEACRAKHKELLRDLIAFTWRFIGHNEAIELLLEHPEQFDFFINSSAFHQSLLLRYGLQPEQGLLMSLKAPGKLLTLVHVKELLLENLVAYCGLENGNDLEKKNSSLFRGADRLGIPGVSALLETVSGWEYGYEHYHYIPFASIEAQENFLMLLADNIDGVSRVSFDPRETRSFLSFDGQHEDDNGLLHISELTVADGLPLLDAALQHNARVEEIGVFARSKRDEDNEDITTALVDFLNRHPSTKVVAPASSEKWLESLVNHDRAPVVIRMYTGVFNDVIVRGDTADLSKTWIKGGYLRHSPVFKGVANQLYAALCRFRKLSKRKDRNNVSDDNGDTASTKNDYMDLFSKLDATLDGVIKNQQTDATDTKPTPIPAALHQFIMEVVQHFFRNTTKESHALQSLFLNLSLFENEKRMTKFPHLQSFLFQNFYGHLRGEGLSDALALLYAFPLCTNSEGELLPDFQGHGEFALLLSNTVKFIIGNEDEISMDADNVDSISIESLQLAVVLGAKEYFEALLPKEKGPRGAAAIGSGMLSSLTSVQSAAKEVAKINISDASAFQALKEAVAPLKHWSEHKALYFVVNSVAALTHPSATAAASR